jgi:tetratricopeptide (TPR) repeat protein
MTTPPLKTQIWSLLILTLLPLLIYFNSLQGAFQFDDRNLIDREWIADLDAFQKNVRVSDYENRPILLWTLAVNNALNKNKVFGFHLFNLMLHVFVCVLIFVILVQTQNFVRQPSREPKQPSPLTAYFPALLFAVHPLNTDSVTYISSRSAVLATFFYLLTLYAFLKIFSSRQPKWKWPVRAFFGLLVVVGMYLALASKLISVTLPIALGLWFWLFIRPCSFPGLGARLFARKWIPVYGSVLLALLSAVLLWGPGILYSPKDQGLELFGRIPYLLVESKVIIFYYLKSFLIPINLNVDIGFPFSTFTTDPKIFLAMITIGAMIFLAWKTNNLWIRGGVLWFFMTLLPTSSIVPLNDLAVEHRMYLPMTLGLGLVVSGALHHISLAGRMRFMVALICLFSLLTLSRNGVWTDEIRLWKDAVAKNPSSPRPHNNLGKAYHENGQLERALFHFLKANENIQQGLAKQYNLTDPREVLKRRVGKKAPGGDKASPGSLKIVADLAEPHYNLASVYLDLGNLEQAQQEYQTALSLNPDYFDALFGLGSVHARLEHMDQAIDYFRQSIQKRKSVTGKKDYPLARLNIGEILGRTGQFEDAIRELSLAIEGDPSMVLGHYNLGLAYLMTGELEQAERALTTCLTLNPRFEPALFNLARVTQAKGGWELSTRQFEQFLSVKGADAEAFFQIGWNYQQAGILDKAQENYEKALVINPDFLKARVHLGKVYMQSQQTDLARSHLEKVLQSNPPPKLREKISRWLQNLSRENL